MIERWECPQCGQDLGDVDPRRKDWPVGCPKGHMALAGRVRHYTLAELKALLTEDGPVLEAKATLLRLTYHGPNPDDVKAALAAAVDALDSPEGDA